MVNALVDAAMLCARTLQAEVAQTITKERGGKTPSEAEVRRRVCGLYDYTCAYILHSPFFSSSLDVLARLPA